MDTRTEHMQVINKLRENFIKARSLQEQTINDWLRKLGQLPEEVRALTSLTPNMTLKDLVPEWWETNPNPAVAAEQIAKANAEINKINEYMVQIEQKALKAIEDFNNMNSQA